MTSRGSHSSCKTDAAIYDDREHVCRAKEAGFLGTYAQFCAAFYHVPKRNTLPHRCLDENQCKVGTRIGSHGHAVHPRTVVAVVKCEDEVGMVTYEARYTNCYDDKMHAEDYFRLDVERGALGALINDNKVNTITMYITFQPCHLTVKDTGGAREKHSCCETLLTVFCDRQSSPLHNKWHNIEICIKPTHLYKADWTLTPVDDQRNNMIKDASEGVKILMKNDIEVTRMEETDWKYLMGKVEDIGKIDLAYKGSIREALDRDIGNVLSDLRIDTTLEKPLSHKCDTGFGIYDDCKHILKREDVPNQNFVGKQGQMCAAFYHIYEGQRPTSSRSCLCLEVEGCFTSRKSRKLKGLHDRPKTTVAIVKCQAGDGKVLYEARYTDCHGVGVFAEEYFVRDAQNGDLGAVINGGCVRKITLLITWPPRHRSASTIWKPRDHSCCVAMGRLNVLCFQPRTIVFSIKLAHIYKEGWPEYEDDVRIGVKTLVGKQIVVTKMEESDWNYLLEIARLAPTRHTPLGFHPWDWQSRKMLDDSIGIFLSRIEQEIHEERLLRLFLRLH